MENNMIESKTVAVREKQIGDTLCIIETAVSATAKESVHNKLKRLITDAAEHNHHQANVA